MTKTQKRQTITVRKIVKKTGLDTKAVRRAIRNKDLKGYRTGRAYVVLMQDFEAFNTPENIRKYQTQNGRPPGGKKAERWPECRHYLECLDNVVRESAKIDGNLPFSCIGCDRYDRLSDDELLPTHQDMVGIYELLGHVFYGTAKRTPDIPSNNEMHITGKISEIAKAADLSYGCVKDYMYMRNKRNSSNTRKIAKALRVRHKDILDADLKEIREIFMSYKPKRKPPTFKRKEKGECPSC